MQRSVTCPCGAKLERHLQTSKTLEHWLEVRGSFETSHAPHLLHTTGEPILSDGQPVKMLWDGRDKEYLSPYSITTWEKSREDFYIRYLTDNAMPEDAQTLPMSIGSSFDAFVKAYLYAEIVAKPGSVGADPQFELETLFEAQVEPQHRKEARDAGQFLFESYRNLGALDGLMLLLGRCIGKPRFEMDVRGTVHGGHVTALGGIPYRVKPDLFFTTEHGQRVIFDWKVTGWCSKAGASPTKGFVKLRTYSGDEGAHDDAKLTYIKGVLASEHGIELFNRVWGRQLSIGAWACGEEVGGDFLGIIHELVVRAGVPKKVRVAEHVSTISEPFQLKTMELSREIWTCLQSGHIFTDRSREESDAHCKLLDGRRDSALKAQANPYASPLELMGG